MVEVNFNELENEIRIDAELYEKQVVRFERQIKKMPHTTFEKEASLIKKGIFDIKSDTYSETGIPFVRISNLKNCGIEINDIIYIPESENNKNLSTFLKRNDIILSKTANAAASIVDIDFCNTSQDTVAIKLKDSSLLNSQFIVAYLNTNIGIKQMQRWFTGNIQMHLNLTVCKEKMLIPIFSQVFQDKIKQLFENRLASKQESMDKYQQAETLLLQSIDLQDFKPSAEAVNIKSFKDSFSTSGRLDAEYYQKKYEEVMNHIITQPHARLNDIVTIYKSIEPGSDVYSEDGLPFLRVADYNKYGITEPDKKLSWDFCTTNAELIKKLKPKKETILFSKDGSVGTAYMLRKDEELITSGAILHLNIRDKKKIIPEYLTLALNSKIVKMQSERDAGGSIILHWRISEIENVVVPIIPIEKQKEIAAMVEESFRLKKQSEHLLEVAKKAVEIAIEEGEERAMLEIYKFLIETEKPEMILMLSVVNDFPSEIFDDIISEFNSEGIFTIPTRVERHMYACALEWSVPTAVVIGLVLKSYADGFLKEAGKDHYQLLKSGIKKLVSKIKDIKHRTLSTKELDPNNNQSKVFSIDAHTKSSKPIKFLFNNDVSLQEWNAYVDSAIDLMEEHYSSNENQLQRKIELLEQPLSSPIFWTYNTSIKEWEPFDLRRDIRERYEEEEKKKLNNGNK